MPGEYAALGHPQGPEPWKRADLVAAASLVGGIFGRGGGNELDAGPRSSTRSTRASRSGSGEGRLRATSAPPRTRRRRRRVRSGKRFTYQAPPKKLARRAAARSTAAARCSAHEVVASSRRAGERGGRALLDGLLRVPEGGCRTRCSSPPRESASGKPLMVVRAAGRLLQPADPHGAGRPRARRARQARHRRPRRLVHRPQPLRPARPRARLRVERDLGGPGHHRHLRGDLRPDGRTTDCTTVFRGRCEPIEVLERVELLARRRAGDETPAGTETLRALRTKLGIVAGRANVGGNPVAAAPACARRTSTRSTRPSASCASTTPRRSASARDFQRAAQRHRLHVQLVLHGRQADRLLQLRRQPAARRRASTTTSGLGKQQFEWRGFDPVHSTSRLTPFSQHPPGRRPEVPRVVEQQAGARASAAPTPTRSPPPTARCCSRTG